MNEINFELRKLTADDIFPMFKIISKIGIREFKSCFDSPEVRKAIASIASGEEGADVNAVGLTVALDVASLLVEHLPDCKEDIYQFLAQVSGKTKSQQDAIYTKIEAEIAFFFFFMLHIFKRVKSGQNPYNRNDCCK